MTRALWSVAVASLVGAWAPARAADASEAGGPDAGWPAPPFLAELRKGTAYVREQPDAGSPVVGILEEKNPIRVTGCAPACEPSGWGLLNGDGAVRLSLLRPLVSLAQTELPSRPVAYWYGKVLVSALEVREQPDLAARAIERQPQGRVLAFLPDAALLERGWLARPRGGFVLKGEVRLESPSAFRGELLPAGPLAFVVRAAPLSPIPGGPSSARAPAQSRFALLSASSRWVITPSGALPRGAVRLAWPKARPLPVPPGAKWVDIDLDEQVLTAYEGDVLVYATLVSSGKAETPTHPGIHRVWYKGQHDLMHGQTAEDEYFVEEVPDVLYFNRGEALHGAFWHDRFGTPVTHGCINLSLADAGWLFEWAPPPLPDGWHSRLPTKDVEALWVVVEKKARPRQPLVRR